jgi:hypothetical protein
MLSPNKELHLLPPQEIDQLICVERDRIAAKLTVASGMSVLAVKSTMALALRRHRTHDIVNICVVPLYRVDVLVRWAAVNIGLGKLTVRGGAVADAETGSQ